MHPQRSSGTRNGEKKVTKFACTIGGVDPEFDEFSYLEEKLTGCFSKRLDWDDVDA